MESVRKDVECVFGKIFSRFRIFRKPILMQQIQSIDDTFRLCAMLHNMICRYDGLHLVGNFEQDWQGAPLSLDELNIFTPSLQQLQLEALDAAEPPTSSALHLGLEQAKVERDPEWSSLRDMLITHYKTAFQKRELK